MIRGYVIETSGEARPVTSLSFLHDNPPGEGAKLLLDLEGDIEADLHELESRYNLPASCIEDCLTGTQRARIDELDDGLFFVLYGAIGAGDRPEFEPRKLTAFLLPACLILVHRENLQTIESLHKRIAKRGASACRELDRVLYEMIDGIVDNYLLQTEAMEELLEDLEDESLSQDVPPSLLTRAGDLRRDVLEVRRLAGALRELLAPVIRGDCETISESVQQQFEHVHDHATHAIEQVDAIRDRLTAVHNNYHTVIASRTNAVMHVLTAFTAVLLPLTLIAGIYGMNLPLWPSPESHASFAIVTGGMIVLGAATFLWFRYRKWL